MTVSSTVDRQEYTALAGQVKFDFDLYVFADSDLAIYVDGVQKALGTDYTVALNDPQPGGSFTFLSALTGGEEVVCRRDVPYTQKDDYTPRGKFPADTLEQGLDRAAVRDQQLDEGIRRALRLAEGDTSGMDLELAPLQSTDTVEGKILGVGSDRKARLYDTSELDINVVYADYKVERHTGDGSTKTFTLAEDPIVVTNLDVFVNGVYQNKDTFSLTSKTVTFNDAPPAPLVAGEKNIEFRYGQGLQLGASAASSTTLSSRTKGGTTVQEEYNDQGQWDRTYLNDLIGADLSAMQVGDVVRVRAVSSAHPTAPAAWKLVATGATPPDATSGINSDGYFYDAASSARKFEVVPVGGAVLVEWFGAKGDGVTDDGGAFLIAIAGSSDGVKIKGASTSGYMCSKDLTLPSTHAVTFDFFGKNNIIYSGTGTLLKIVSGVGASDPVHRVWLRAKANTAGSGTAVQVEDSINQKINVLVEDFAVGVDLHIAANWCEANEVSGFIVDCDKGITFTRSGGNYSFAGTYLKNLWIQSTNAVAATPYGIHVGTLLDLYRSRFDNVVIFPRKANAVGFYCNGKMRNCTGAVHFEGDGVITSNTAWSFGPNADLLRFSIQSDIRGGIGTWFSFDAGIAASAYASGIVTDSLSNEQASIRRQGILSGIRAIYDEDASTVRYVEDVSAADVVRHRYANQPQFLDYADGKPIDAQIIPVGSGVKVEASSATPDVKGVKTLRLGFSAATTVTDFLNGATEQTIVVHHNNTNATIQHGTNLYLQGSANYTPAAAGARHVFQKYGGVWWEISRIEP